MADKYAHKAQQTRESRRQDAEALLRERMPRPDAERYAALLADRGVLESGDEDWAIALLTDHIKRSRARAIVDELIRAGVMEDRR